MSAAHAGWRGLAARVPEATVGAMAREFGSRPEDLLAVAGPAIGPCCYEVGEEVAQEVARASSAEAVRRIGKVKPHVDLHAAVRAQLSRRGVTRIQTAAACTRCAADWLWSYRRDGRAAGRNLAFVWIASET
jgi:YfiH family protein